MISFTYFVKKQEKLFYQTFLKRFQLYQKNYFFLPVRSKVIFKETRTLSNKAHSWKLWIGTQTSNMDLRLLSGARIFQWCMWSARPRPCVPSWSSPCCWWLLAWNFRYLEGMMKYKKNRIITLVFKSNTKNTSTMSFQYVLSLLI